MGMCCRSMVLAAIGLIGFSAGMAHGQAAPDTSRSPDGPPAAPAGNAAPAVPDVAVPSAETINQLVQRNGGSLMRATMNPQNSAGGTVTMASASFFSVPEPKPKLMHKHDLLTIIVREDSNFSSIGDTDLQHQSDVDAKITSFVKLQMNPLSVVGVIPNNPLETAGTGQRDFKGQATVDRTDTMTARITASVVDVKPNGTLVVEATEKIKTDEEEQTMNLVGTCRVDDITPDNTVLSNQLYDLELTKTHTGAVRDTTSRGFIPRLLDSLNPF